MFTITVYNFHVPVAEEGKKDWNLTSSSLPADNSFLFFRPASSSSLSVRDDLLCCPLAAAVFREASSIALSSEMLVVAPRGCSMALDSEGLLEPGLEAILPRLSGLPAGGWGEFDRDREAARRTLWAGLRGGLAGRSSSGLAALPRRPLLLEAVRGRLSTGLDREPRRTPPGLPDRTSPPRLSPLSLLSRLNRLSGLRRLPGLARLSGGGLRFPLCLSGVVLRRLSGRGSRLALSLGRLSTLPAAAFEYFPDTFCDRSSSDDDERPRLVPGFCFDAAGLASRRLLRSGLLAGNCRRAGLALDRRRCLSARRLGLLTRWSGDWRLRGGDGEFLHRHSSINSIKLLQFSTLSHKSVKTFCKQRQKNVFKMFVNVFLLKNKKCV